MNEYWWWMEIKLFLFRGYHQKVVAALPGWIILQIFSTCLSVKKSFSEYLGIQWGFESLKSLNLSLWSREQKPWTSRDIKSIKCWEYFPSVRDWNRISMPWLMVSTILFHCIGCNYDVETDFGFRLDWYWIVTCDYGQNLLNFIVL